MFLPTTKIAKSEKKEPKVKIMLRNLLITSSSGGIVYFEKSWTHVYDEQKVRMVGGLITTIQQFSRQSTGMYLTNLKFQESKNLIWILLCLLFYKLFFFDKEKKFVEMAIMKCYLFIISLKSYYLRAKILSMIN